VASKRANLTSVGEEKQAGSEEENRADRDRERSHEAHWEVAEAGAEDADGPRRQTPKRQGPPILNRDDFVDDETTDEPE
jgi:hypothetical protein